MKFYLLSFVLMFTFSSLRSQSVIKSVPFLKKNGFYTLVKYGSNIPLIEKNFQDLKIFSNSFVKYQDDDKWGLMNMDGKIEVDNKYDEINFINNSIIEFLYDGKKYYSDTLFNSIDDSLTKDLYKFKAKKIFDLPLKYYKYLIDTSILNYKTDDNKTIVTYNKCCNVKGKMSFLYFDKNTNNTFFNCEIVEEFTEKEEILSKGILLLKSDGEYISKFSQVNDIGLGYYSVSKNVIKVIDEYGTVLLGQDDFYLYGIIDGNGNKITPLKYNSISPFNSGLSLVVSYGNQDNQFSSDTKLYNSGFVNTKGDIVIPMKNEYRRYSFNEGLIVDNLSNKVSYMDTTGKNSLKLGGEFFLLVDEETSLNQNNSRFRNFKDGLLFVGVRRSIFHQTGYLVNSFNEVCLINQKGKVLKCGLWNDYFFTFPTEFKNGHSLIFYEKTNKYGLINQEGNYILNPKYDFVYGYPYKMNTELKYKSNQENLYTQLPETSLTETDNRADLNEIKSFVYQNLILVNHNSNIFYVDINGFEYLEK